MNTLELITPGFVSSEQDRAMILPTDESFEAPVQLSTTFYPTAQLRLTSPDYALISSDEVFFFVHSSVLFEASSNQFGSLIPLLSSTISDGDSLRGVFSLPENADVLNIVLHTIYGLSCAYYRPKFDAIATAVDSLSRYGIDMENILLPGNPLGSLILSLAPVIAVQVYALAARYNVYPLASSISPHLLSLSLATLSEDMACKIGALYLKRLYDLHLLRMNALKVLLIPPPYPHPETKKCNFKRQQRLSRAWSLASSALFCESSPDTSTSLMESVLIPLVSSLECEDCQKALKERVKKLVVQWTHVQRTI